MSGRTLTSSLIVRLIDQVSAPARKIAGSLLGLQNTAARGVGGALERLSAAQSSNNRALEKARGGLVDAAAGYFALRGAIAAPVTEAVAFEAKLEDIAQKSDMSAEAVKKLGQQIKGISQATAQGVMAVGDTIDFLVGAGAKADDAVKMAGPIGKAATAYRASAEDLAKASFAVSDNLKVPADQLAYALDIMAQAGKEGAYELKDMAGDFPALTAGAQALGMTGTKAVADLSAALEVARKGAADGSIAANNMSNFMQKIVSKETIKNFKKFGIDVPKELKKAAKAGESPIEHMLGLINKITDGGKPEKIAALFGDKQVVEFIRPMLQNMEEYKRIREEALKASGVVEKDFQSRIQKSGAIMQRLKATTEILAITIGNALLPAISRVTDALVPLVTRLSDFAEKYPQVTTAIVGSLAGLIALRVAMAGAAFVGLSLRGALLSAAIGVTRVAAAAYRGAAGMVGLQSALAAMSGARYSGLAKTIDAFKGMALAVPGVSAIGAALSAVGAALATISAPVWGAIAVGVAAVAVAGSFLWKYWDRVTSVLSGVGRAIGEVLSPAIEAVRPALDFLAPVGEAIAAGWEKAKKVISDFGNWIGSFFQREVLSEDQKAQWENAGHDAAMRMVEAIKSAFSGLVQWAASIGSQIGSAIADGAISAVNRVKGWFGGGSSPTPDASAPPSGHRARGGSVWSGASYLVGEKGPEIFTPGKTGTITPNGHGGGAPQVHIAPGAIVIQGISDMAAASREAARMIGNDIARQLRGSHADLPAR